MRPALKDKALEILAANRLMSVATLRPDGWPQATLVGYVSDDLTLYFICSRHSQKARNIARDNRVSVAIGRDVTDPELIAALSVAARADPVRDEAALDRVLGMMLAQYPEYSALGDLDLSDVLAMRLEPEVISVLDYSRGFGHSDLVVLADGPQRAAG